MAACYNNDADDATAPYVYSGILTARPTPISNDCNFSSALAHIKSLSNFVFIIRFARRQYISIATIFSLHRNSFSLLCIFFDNISLPTPQTDS